MCPLTPFRGQRFNRLFFRRFYASTEDVRQGFAEAVHGDGVEGARQELRFEPDAWWHPAVMPDWWDEMLHELWHWFLRLLDKLFDFFRPY